MASQSSLTSLVDALLHPQEGRFCERHIVSAWGPYRAEPECRNYATVSDLETEYTFCPEDWKRFLRGDWEGR